MYNTCKIASQLDIIRTCRLPSLGGGCLWAFAKRRIMLEVHELRYPSISGLLDNHSLNMCGCIGEYIHHHVGILVWRGCKRYLGK